MTNSSSIYSNPLDGGMPVFRHITPPLRLFSGSNSLEQLSRELRRGECQRALILCGSSLAREESLIGMVQSALGDRCVGVFSGVRAHSPVSAVEAVAEELLRVKADSVVAVGGGSAIVTARAASIMVAENCDLKRLATWRDEKGDLKSPKLMAPKMPQFVVPTTPTTAIVKAGSAVLDEEEQDRLALYDPKTRALSVFIHPSMVDSAPASLVISASLNTFSMAIEGLTSRMGDPLSDALLMHALRLLSIHLTNPSGIESSTVRSELVLAAILCGQGTDYTGAGITTVLGHAIGGRFDVENGIVNAILLPHVIRFNADACEDRLPKVLSALGETSHECESIVESLVPSFHSIFQGLGIPRRLRDIGVARSALSDIAESAMGDWFLKGNPRPVQNAGELNKILEEAW